MCFTNTRGNKYLTDYFASFKLNFLFKQISKFSGDDNMIDQGEWLSFWKSAYGGAAKVKSGEWPGWGPKSKAYFKDMYAQFDLDQDGIDECEFYTKASSMVQDTGNTIQCGDKDCQSEMCP